MLDVVKLKKIFLKFYKKVCFFNFKKVLNIPNFLTFVRIFLIIPFVFSFINENYKKALEILIWSGITDLLDGVVARRMHQQTKFGAILDPMADKLTLISIMVCTSVKISHITPFVLALIFKEVCMIIAGAILIKKYKTTIKARWYGKLSTAFFYFSIILVLFFKIMWGIENRFLISVLMSLTTLLMFHAMLRYLFKFISIVRTKRFRKK